jgi:hypothetical protein
LQCQVNYLSSARFFPKWGSFPTNQFMWGHHCKMSTSHQHLERWVHYALLKLTSKCFSF